MKKTVFLLISLLILGGSAFAKDVIPTKVFDADINSYGVYQISERSMTLYSQPNTDSKVVKKIAWNDESTDVEGLDLADLFVLYLPDRNLSLLTVVDETDDWVKVVYNGKTSAAGWLKKDDPYKFMPWGVFYNIYGKKYGLYQLKHAPASCNSIRVSPDNLAQEVGTLNMPKKIILNVIKGNWALISVSDLDKYPKTGFVRWRGDNGEKYYFPLIKKVVGVN